jgi:type I restriction enzyme, S subunit
MTPWPVVPLGEVAETALGKMLDKGKSRGHARVPYLRNVNVQWGRIDTHDLLEMELAEDERERFEVRAGDLLLCEGGEIGRCAIWDGRSDYLAYQKALHRVRPGERLDARFLRYLMQHHAETGVLASLSTGSTIAHLPQQQLRRVPVPLPDLVEQRRIVELLEDHLSRLDAGLSYLDAARLRLVACAEQTLAAALEGRATTVHVLDELLEVKLSNGKSVPTADEGFPVLRLTALRDGVIDLAERKTGAWNRDQALRFLVHRDDFLIARGNGSLDLVGRGGLVCVDPDPVAFPDTMIRARLRRDRVLPEFLALIWNARSTRDQIERSARTTAGIFKVNQRDLGGIELPIPTLDDQRSLVEHIGLTRSGLRRMASEVVRADCRAGGLRRALLSAAFAGRLTGASSDLDRVEELVDA